jgi:hypothetical protein
VAAGLPELWRFRPAQRYRCCRDQSSPWVAAAVQAAREVVLHVNVGEVCAFEISAEGVRYLLNPEATDFEAAKSNDAFVGPGT